MVSPPISVVIITDRPSCTIVDYLLLVSGRNYHVTSRLHRPRESFLQTYIVLQTHLFNRSFHKFLQCL